MVRLCLAMLLALCATAWPAQPVIPAGDDSTSLTQVVSDTLDPVVITAPPMAAPLEHHFDPRSPQQPLPAHDGAAFLKTVPGMALIRKGGTDGDPVFRGMAASRLNVLLDGEQVLGGCGMRMDPPTAYVSPETFDQVTLLKGPQSVVHGPGSAAGTVLFERESPRFATPGYRLLLSPMGGNFGRMDGTADLQVGNERFYLRGLVAQGRSGNYEDGEGRTVHSEYRRWNARTALGWTPDEQTRLEVSTTRGNGEAAYADRGVDGSEFANENYGLRFARRPLSGAVTKVEAQVYSNYIDHVMDDYSLRPFTPEGAGHEPSAMNPDRLTTGGRFALGLRPASRTQLTLGGDLQFNRHTNRSTMSMNMGMGTGTGTGMGESTGTSMGGGTGMGTGSTMGDSTGMGTSMGTGAGKVSAFTPGQLSQPYQQMDRTRDADFSQVGVFAEGVQHLHRSGRLVAGLRLDRWRAEDHRQALGMMGTANPTAGEARRARLPSAFLRYEHELRRAGATLYAGLGHNQRFPDYWELFGDRQGPDPADLSGFATTNPEKTTQVDLGASFRAGALSGFVSGFYSQIADYILIQGKVRRGMGAMAREVAVVRNIDATTLGGEAGLSYTPTAGLRLSPSLAYVRGTNTTDDHPLAQLPPLETRLAVDWQGRNWSLGSLLRLVADQDRYAVDEGNIVGQDLGPTPGFAVFSLNAGWKFRPDALIAAGIDNLLDRRYAEHLSRAGDLVPGFTQTTRVEEPGRTLWVKATVAVDSGP
ncbi:MAG: TonB-dependent receptor [Candidatus Latescibacteria bacterium]|nr:TonB-dependent receptor [Candidatus Latescibacterota bacterium]